MERIGNYVDQGGCYSKTAQSGKGGSSAKTAGANAAKEGRTSAPLSAAARKLLKELKKSYGNMDFIVADYETDEEAASYLSRGVGEYSTLLTTKELEKMAADESYKKETLDTLNGAVARLGEMKEQLGGKGDEIARMGISINDEGKISFFAMLEKAGEKQRERIGKRTTVFAPSVDELAEKISQVDWNAIKEEPHNPAGQRFDFTI